MRSIKRLRLYMTGWLTLALVAGVPFATTHHALAETVYGEGEITIDQLHNEGATYDAYMLFKANISSNDQATHVVWASDSMQAVVLPFLDDNGYAAWLADNHSGSDRRERAQNAAEFIAYRIAGSREDVGAATTPRTTEGLSFANELAQMLASRGVDRQTTVVGKAFKGTEGYYLFVTTDSTTDGHSEAGTAPIWMALGGSLTRIDEKSAIPTVDKHVLDDAATDWGKVADANTGQDLAYRLTGTLPTNYGAFDFYHYAFTDTLDAGLTIDIPANKTIADVVTIRIGDERVTPDSNNLIVTYAQNVLSVDFVNLKSEHWSSRAINRNTVITVEYPCRMKETRVIGEVGNLNGVYLTYTDDPVSLHDGRTARVDVKVFAYSLLLHKVDEQTNESLANASFTIQAEGESGPYVQQDGSLGSAAHVFVTGSDGTFEVKGLDEGVYLIKETEAPTGWEKIDGPIVVTITSGLEDAGLKLASLNATISGGDDVDSNAASINEVDGHSSVTGLVSINVTNDRWLKMPLTGMDGMGAGATGGSVLAVMGGTALALRRSRYR